MSINHLNSSTPVKLNVSCNDLECESIESKSRVDMDSGFYDGTSWVSQFTEPNSILKDLLYDWTNLSVGTGRSSYGTYNAVRNKLIEADAKCALVNIKGQLNTNVGNAAEWYFRSPSFKSNALSGLQQIVYSHVQATDYTTGEVYEGTVTDLNVVGFDGAIKILFNNLTPSILNLIQIKYEYILSQTE